MQLTEHRPDGQYYVHSVRDDAVRIVETSYSRSLLLTPDRGVVDWPVAAVADIDEHALAPIVEYRPDVVLLATGRSIVFPDHRVQYALLRHGIGLEVMTLEAAARTFNVLASEARRVMAAMIWEQKSNAAAGT